MRASQEYNRQFAGLAMLSLVEKYQMESSLAEQDWFTLLSWEKPNLFYPLSCGFNFQTDEEYEEYEEKQEQKPLGNLQSVQGPNQHYPLEWKYLSLQCKSLIKYWKLL